MTSFYTPSRVVELTAMIIGSNTIHALKMCCRTEPVRSTSSESGSVDRSEVPAADKSALFVLVEQTGDLVGVPVLPECQAAVLTGTEDRFGMQTRVTVPLHL